MTAAADNRSGRDARCRHCRFCRHDRASLESEIPGLAALGSAFGASLGDSRLCGRHDRLISPGDSCRDFSPV
ncbi:hypothetical protein ACL2XP_04605 [Sodalis sp. RH21]|uniref:hypothetical protein n=1 Tax=unclassified Sodalis (in: enterobacteria) TaxID=2636512 RepID=UPI0039B57BBD